MFVFGDMHVDDKKLAVFYPAISVLQRYLSLIHILIGPGGNYHLGRKVTVEVVKADKKSREIDFKIVYNSNRVKGNGKRRRSKQKGRS